MHSYPQRSGNPIQHSNCIVETTDTEIIAVEMCCSRSTSVTSQVPYAHQSLLPCNNYLPYFLIAMARCLPESHFIALTGRRQPLTPDPTEYCRVRVNTSFNRTPSIIDLATSVSLARCCYESFDGCSYFNNYIWQEVTYVHVACLLDQARIT